MPDLDKSRRQILREPIWLATGAVKSIMCSGVITWQTSRRKCIAAQSKVGAKLQPRRQCARHTVQ
jgi:hypothetical protein